MANDEEKKFPTGRFTKIQFYFIYVKRFFTLINCCSCTPEKYIDSMFFFAFKYVYYGSGFKFDLKPHSIYTMFFSSNIDCLFPNSKFVSIVSFNKS